MDKVLTEFINKRIKSNYHKLQQDEEWKKANEEYRNCYDKLYNELQGEQEEELDDIIDLKHILMEYESNFAYKVGVSDAIKLFKL